MHGSYLQGMETSMFHFSSKFREIRTDPTYKEWKPGTREKRMYARVLHARILPTRNGNDVYLLLIVYIFALHGSYLQGMETSYQSRLS